MRTQWISSIVVAVSLVASVAAAQTAAAPAAAPPPPAPGGAFEKLSPGNQKIALAIFDSEQRATTLAGPAKPLSLDEIAAMKQGGKGWGVIFKEMKANGLVQDKNLGQAVSRSHRLGTGTIAARTTIGPTSGRTIGPASGKTTITTASGRTTTATGSERTAITTASGRTMTVDGLDRSAAAARQRGSGSDASRGDAGTAAASRGGDSGSGSSAARGGSGSHGVGRGK